MFIGDHPMIASRKIIFASCVSFVSLHVLDLIRRIMQRVMLLLQSLRTLKVYCRVSVERIWSEMQRILNMAHGDRVVLPIVRSNAETILFLVMLVFLQPVMRTEFMKLFNASIRFEDKACCSVRKYKTDVLRNAENLKWSKEQIDHCIVRAR